MLTKNLLVLKKHALLISSAYTIALLIVSLITLDLGGLDSIVPSYGDKIFHFCAYAVLTFLWFNTFNLKFKFSKIKTLLLAAIICMAFGIIIEVLQKVLTFTRYFDVADITANVLGVIFSALILLITVKEDVKKY